MLLTSGAAGPNAQRIYEVHNDGNWYNTGFMLGFGVLLGGGAGSKRSR